jgi:aminoglycoside phosphotransferase (APT) family kinase protein
MMRPTSPPPATGVRLPWEALPARVRRAIEAWLGSPVVAARTQSGGFSPGLAARLRTAAGRRIFAKVIGPEPNPYAPAFHRREARIVGALPPGVPVPRLLGVHDEGPEGWIALFFEDVAGSPPAQPWRPEELDRVLETVVALHRAVTPSPLPTGLVAVGSQRFAERLRGWRALQSAPPDGLDPWSRRHLDALADLEDEAPAAVAGDTLLHGDLRADNVLLTPDRVLLVDWPHACTGAAWLDVVLLAPSVTMQGGPLPEAVLARHPASPSRVELAPAVAAWAGFLTREALQPPPAGLPTLRAFQAAQGEVARAWLARLTGWT